MEVVRMSMNFDNQLDQILNEEIIIPKNIIDKKEKAYEEIKVISKENKFSQKKKIISVAAAICIVCFTFFVDDAFATIGDKAFTAIKGLFFKDEGVQKAIDNGLVQNLGETNVMKDHGVEIKVTDITYDSSKLAMSLNLKFEDKSVLKNLKEIEFDYDLIDNNGRHIEARLIERRSSEEAQANGKRLIIIGSDSSIAVNEENGEVKYNLVLRSMEPISGIDDLNLDIRAIRLLTALDNKFEESMFLEAESKLEEYEKFNYKERGLRLYKQIDGNWKTNIKIDEKLKSGKEIMYVPQGNNGEIIKVVKAELLPTCMYVTFEFDSAFGPEDRGKATKKIDEATVVDDNGNVHKSTLKGYKTGDDNGHQIKVKSFEITSFDYDGNFKVMLTDFNGENKEITLIKNTAK
jgi:hypothetical protein